MNFKQKIIRIMLSIGLILIVILGWFIFSIPKELFSENYSTVVLDKKGEFIGARIAKDGQWRFPVEPRVPAKFEKCIVTFEDKRFYTHPGFDYKAVGRAIWQNISMGKKVSGASTLTMQVVRLSRKKQRNIFIKVIETLMALRLELSLPKKEILSLYTAHAPFGGNVVGLSAASWRYYGKAPHYLSWGESATLAVLPNSPTLIHPGKNSHLLLKKRNRLLKKMAKEGIIDSLTAELAMLEPLPGKPLPLPSYAPHFVDRISESLRQKKSKGETIKSTIDLPLQHRINSILIRHHIQLRNNGIYNASALVMDVKTGDIISYVGNLDSKLNSEHEGKVDNIISRRSTGSILKPLLYGAMVDEGQILPGMLIPDIPTFINKYSPKNFNGTYDGAVPASKALARSLNIPSVHMLQKYTPGKFIHKLKQLGITTIDKSAEYYGLTLILGGGEARLIDLAKVYVGMARTLKFYAQTKQYRNDEYDAIKFISVNNKKKESINQNAPVISAGAIWLTFDAMQKVSRPDEEKFWTNFGTGRRVAWKTGTSFGNRDAWAIGVTPDYVVAVWAGNSNGDSRTGLTGVGTAAPIMFDIFNTLPFQKEWFPRPDSDLETIVVCKKSGYLASEICSETEEIFMKKNKTGEGICPYHHLIHLDQKRKYRVHGDCESPTNMVHESWFVMPPSIEKYYKEQHPDYKELPLFRKDCAGKNVFKTNSMDLIYPQNPAKIYMPKSIENNEGSTIFEVSHRNLSAVIYWHLDEKYLGVTTRGMHQRSLSPAPGKHRLRLVDDAGETLDQAFEILVN